MNERQRFHERLRRGPMLLDGAMGTLLYASGVHQRACLDELPTTRPDLVGAIHRAYLDAGAEVARDARDVSGRDALVAGSIGPLGAPTRDVLKLDDETIRGAFREQIDGLLEGGVDMFILETFVDLRHLLIAADEARRATAELPIVAQ